MLLGSLREEDNVVRFVETENHIASFIKEKRSYC